MTTSVENHNPEYLRSVASTTSVDFYVAEATLLIPSDYTIATDIAEANAPDSSKIYVVFRRIDSSKELVSINLNNYSVI